MKRRVAQVAVATMLIVGLQSPGTPAMADAGTEGAEPRQAVVVDPFRPTPQLEKRAYIKDMKVLAQHFPGEDRREKMNMMAVGAKRYLVQNSRILDISDPLNPVLVSEGAWKGGHQIQVAYNSQAGKWLAITSDMHSLQPGTDKPNSGISIFDISDPSHPVMLSQWSNLGTHRNYYDGGRYAYVTGASSPEQNTGPGDLWFGAASGLQVVDLSDPSRPTTVASWHYPGQMLDEVEERKQWLSANDRARMTLLHGPEYVPLRVEDGGKYGYGPWGALGMMIHDLSDPEHPKLVSRWESENYVSGLGGMQFHTIDIARLDRGFVITNPEVFWPECRYPQHDSYVIDVSDPKDPKKLATLPMPLPPAEAPYTSFCGRYGRFGPHNPPHLKAPGKPAANFTCYSFFGAGLHCYDITDPRNPKVSAYFIPEQGGKHSEWEFLAGPTSETIRTVDNIYVEWDRKLIWAATDTGLYLLSAPALGEPILKPMPVKQWTYPSINKGFDTFKPRKP